MNPSPWPRQSPGVRRLKDSPAAPAEATPARQAEEKTESREPEAPLCCAHCGHVIGPPTAEASWFPGFRWEYARCGACKTHLGWAFHGESDFLGRVLERLTSPS